MPPGVIALTGFMGSGKSTVGKMLAERLGCPFTDLDEAVEQAAGKSVAQIFAEDGEEAFRELEITALERILRDTPRYAGEPAGRAASGKEPRQGLVLALGGGTVMQPQARRLLEGRCICIYLKAGVDTLLERMEAPGAAGRPLLAGETDPGALRARISALLAEREPVYSSAAGITVSVDGLQPGETVRRLESIIDNFS